MSTEVVKNIVIVGGGTAGWLTAGVLAAEHGHNLAITLIESPEVKTIGVGEGTWPSMRRTLSRIGIEEKTFIAVCGASFKQGSKFMGWRTAAKEDFYYHPFTEPQSYGTTNYHRAWQESWGHLPFGDAASVQGALCELGLAPKHPAAPDYAGAMNYGYHLDAGAFAKLLHEHCTNKLAVRYVSDHVDHIHLDDAGAIAALSTRHSGRINGDLFIDCTGTASLLLGQTLKVPFIKKDKYLFNDSALAVQVPYSTDNDEITSATMSVAQDAGWIWDIGLSHRRGVGYVYSSAHTSDSDAERCVRRYIATSMGEESANKLSVRKLPIVTGYRAELWRENCVAVGMSAGFIEPLEASALAMVEMSANMLSDELPFAKHSMASVASRFNRRFVYRWERVIDFLKLHYVLSERRDTAYWQDAVSEETRPDHLRELLDVWAHRSPYYQDFVHNEEMFPSASYQYVLYGMGFETKYLGSAKSSDNLPVANRAISESPVLLGKLKSVLVTNRALIKKINTEMQNDSASYQRAFAPSD